MKPKIMKGFGTALIVWRGLEALAYQIEQQVRARPLVPDDKNGLRGARGHLITC